MSEEDFLKRWLRRKQEAQRVSNVPPAAKPEPAAEAPPIREGANPPEPTFDPASLPPIESITAASDISAFLRAGVPAELTRAALRRVWTADPVIRDFVGLAENAWDFTDPNAIPGFGSLELTEEVREMIARVVQQTGEVLGQRSSEVILDETNPKDSSALKSEEESADAPMPSTDQVQFEQRSLQSNKETTAVQHDLTRDNQEHKRLPRRGHGGALPQY
jgi:Protein of unknown function (DUF3306)